MRYLILTVAALCAATPLLAQEEAAERPSQQVHVVRTGDTLWDLASRYLRNPFRWPEIFRLNTDLVRDPHWIYPAQRLRIPGPGEGPFTLEQFEEIEPERTIFYPRETETATAVPIIRAAGTADVPILTPGDFYRAAFLAQDREVAPVGRIVRRISPTLVPVELPDQISLHDRVTLALVSPGAMQVGQELQLFRRDRAVRGHGRVWQPTGTASVVAVEGAVATAVITQVFDAIAIGDQALRMEEFPVAAGVTPLPSAGPGGRVVAFQRPNPLQPTQAIVFLDVGAQAGVQEGDEFLAYLPAQQRRTDYRPEVQVGLLQVVRVTEQTSSARILELQYPALEPGIRVRLVGKMP